MGMQINKKKGNKMAALATPKKNSYIVKRTVQRKSLTVSSANQQEKR